MSSSLDENEKAANKQSTKKKKSHGRMSSVNRQIRAMTFELGSDCKCSMFECFKRITSHERNAIIKSFNMLSNWNDQFSYLTSLISVNLIVPRGPRQDDSMSHDCSFCYIVKVKRDNTMGEIQFVRKHLFLYMASQNVDFILFKLV